MPSPNCKTCGQLLPPEPEWTVERALGMLDTYLHNEHDWPERELQQALAFLRSHIEQQQSVLDAQVEVVKGHSRLLDQAVAAKRTAKPLSDDAVRPLTREAWRAAISEYWNPTMTEDEDNPCPSREAAGWRWLVENGHVPGESDAD